jgi:hypothetical protein
MTRWIVVAAIAAAGAAPDAAAEVAVSLEGGWAALTNAQKSAEAVFDGANGGATFGAGVTLDVTRSLFVGVGGRFFRKEGERAFVAGPWQPAFGLGLELKVRVIPVHALVGWRFRPGKSLVPHVGLGVGATSYHEESVVGDVAEEPVSETKPSGLAFAGLTYGQGRVRFGLDVSYSMAPDTLGAGGVSAVYGEDDVGGLTAMGRIVFVP